MHVCYIHAVYLFLHVIIQYDCVVCLIELIVEVCCRYDMFLFVWLHLMHVLWLHLIHETHRLICMYHSKQLHSGATFSPAEGARGVSNTTAETHHASKIGQCYLLHSPKLPQ